MADDDVHHANADDTEAAEAEMAAIVGGSVAGGVVFILICVAVCYCVRRCTCRRQREETPVTSPSPPEPKFSPQWASRGATLPASLSLHLSRSLSALSLPEVAIGHAQFGGRDVRNLRFTSFLAQPTSGWRSVSPEVPVAYETIPLPPPPSCDLASHQSPGGCDVALRHHGDDHATPRKDSVVYETISIPCSPVVMTPCGEGVTLQIPEDDYSSLPLPFPSPPSTPELEEMSFQGAQAGSFDASGYAIPALDATEDLSDQPRGALSGPKELQQHKAVAMTHSYERPHPGVSELSHVQNQSDKNKFHPVNQEDPITYELNSSATTHFKYTPIVHSNGSATARHDHEQQSINDADARDGQSKIKLTSTDNPVPRKAHRAESLLEENRFSRDSRQGRRRWQSESDTLGTATQGPHSLTPHSQKRHHPLIPSDLRESGVSVVFCRRGPEREESKEKQDVKHESPEQKFSDTPSVETEDKLGLREEGVAVLPCRQPVPMHIPEPVNKQQSADPKLIECIGDRSGETGQNSSDKGRPKELSFNKSASLPYNVLLPSAIGNETDRGRELHRIRFSDADGPINKPCDHRSAACEGSDIVSIDKSPCSPVTPKTSKEEMSAQSFVILPSSPINCVPMEQRDFKDKDIPAEYASVPKSPCTRVPNKDTLPKTNQSVLGQKGPQTPQQEAERPGQPETNSTAKEEDEDYTYVLRSPSSRAPYTPVRRAQGGQPSSDYDHLLTRPTNRVSVLCHLYAQLQPQGSGRPDLAPQLHRSPGSQSQTVRPSSRSSDGLNQGGSAVSQSAGNAHRGSGATTQSLARTGQNVRTPYNLGRVETSSPASSGTSDWSARSPTQTAQKPHHSGDSTPQKSDSGIPVAKSPPGPPVMRGQHRGVSPPSSGNSMQKVKPPTAVYSKSVSDPGTQARRTEGFAQIGSTSPSQTTITSSQKGNNPPRSSQGPVQGGSTSPRQSTRPKPGAISPPGMAQKSKRGADASPKSPRGSGRGTRTSSQSSEGSTQSGSSSPRLAHSAKSAGKDSPQRSPRSTEGVGKSLHTAEKRKMSAKASPDTVQRSKASTKGSSPSPSATRKAASASLPLVQTSKASADAMPRSSESAGQRTNLPPHTPGIREMVSRPPGSERSVRRKVPYEECVVRL